MAVGVADCLKSRSLAKLELLLPIMPSEETSTADFSSPTTIAAASSNTPTAHTTPPELEQTLATLISHRSVLGYLVLSRSSTDPVSIIRHAGVVFEGEQGKKYASAVKKIVDACTSGLQEVGGGATDEVRFMRIRTHRHELLISPDPRYLLVVLQNPTMT